MIPSGFLDGFRAAVFDLDDTLYAFERNNTLGYACAAGILMMLMMVLVTVFDFGFVEKKVHYQ